MTGPRRNLYEPGPSGAPLRMRIGVDFDDVLYPYHHYLRRRILRKWGVDLSGDRITTFYYELHPKLARRGVTRPQLWREVRNAWLETDSHQEAALLDPHAARVLKDLKRRHTVVLISARHDEALPQLEIFLRRHKIEPHSILLSQHDKRGFDVLIDDFPQHAEQNAESGGWSLLYHSDENSNYDESRHPRILRVHDWSDVEASIRRIEARGHAP